MLKLVKYLSECKYQLYTPYHTLWVYIVNNTFILITNISQILSKVQMMAGTIRKVKEWHSVNSQKLMLHRPVYDEHLQLQCLYMAHAVYSILQYCYF